MRSSLSLSLFISAVLAVPAVALAQQVAPAPTPAPASGAAPGALPAGSASAPVTIPPPPTVNDPMLAPMPPAATNIANWKEALVYVRARSTDLRIAYDEVLRAEAQQRVALAGTLPSINATGTLTHQFLTDPLTKPAGYQIVGEDGKPLTTFPPPNGGLFDSKPVGSVTVPGATIPRENSASAAITAVQPILATRVWHNIGTAKANTATAKFSVDNAKRVIALNVANALVGVVTAERIAELNRVGFRNALERLALTQRKRALGAANGLDVVRAQQDVEIARGTLVTGDESLRQSREALGLAIGLPQQVGVSRDLDLNGLEQDARMACQAAPSIDDRADVLAARSRLNVAERNITDVKLQFMPTINAQSTLATATSNSVSGVATGPNTTWNIQGVLSIPLWEGGARYGFLRDNRALADEALQNLEALRRKATIEVEQARRNVTVAEQSQKVASDARALAAETDRLTQAAYREGQGTSLELVVAASALRQAEITLALRDFDVVKARVAAILALANCPW
jgi:outer membrane protein TolC